MTPTILSLYPSKPSLYRYFTSLYPYCIRTVPLLYYICSVPSLYPDCTPTVPSQYPTVPSVYPYCTLTVPLLYPECTLTVPWLYPHCTNSTLTVPTLYQRCPYILVMVLPHTLPKWSLLWRGGGGAFSAKATSDSFRILTGNNGHFKTFQLSVLIKLTDIKSFNRCDMVFGCIRQIYKNVK